MEFSIVTDIVRPASIEHISHRNSVTKSEAKNACFFPSKIIKWNGVIIKVCAQARPPPFQRSPSPPMSTQTPERGWHRLCDTHQRVKREKCDNLEYTASHLTRSPCDGRDLLSSQTIVIPNNRRTCGGSITTIYASLPARVSGY